LSSAPAAQPPQGWPLALLVLLGVLWTSGIATRSVWTPDEPREYALATSMMVQDQLAVPLLAGLPFCEKPPLTYWMAAASMRVYGARPLAARLPNLLWGLVTILATALLAASMTSTRQRARAALVAALVAGTAWLDFQHTVWLATDAPLLAASALTLLGAWLGLDAHGSRQRWWGYGLFHLGLAAGFLSKNILGVMGPLLALLLFIAWERRWRELRRIEIWAGALLSLGLIGAWIASVAQLPEGREYLHVFLWDNSVGRFLPVATDADYRSGHQNSPGKLLIEVAAGLLPWLFALLVALTRAGSRAWRGGPDGANWRFLIAATVPLILLLSFSSTVRDVYALPSMVGFAAMLGIWATETDSASPEARIALRLTRGLLVMAGVVFGALALLVPWVTRGTVLPGGWTALLALLAAVLVISAASRLVPAAPVLRGLGSYAAGLTLLLILASPAIEPGQDLEPTARQAVTLANGRPLLLTTRDETMTAALYYTTRSEARMVSDFGAAARAQPTALALIEQDTDRLTPVMRARLARLWPGLASPRKKPDSMGTVTALQSAGWRIWRDLPNPGGRHYLLLAPPAPEATQ
jgi:4-amino-4-deoxy-L-arabinose transferase-like glycosyltransferase